MLKTEVEQVRAMATKIAAIAIDSQVGPLIKHIDKLESRLAKLEKANTEAKPKGKTDGKL